MGVLSTAGCAHNPTGIDPTAEQWEKIADLVQVPTYELLTVENTVPRQGITGCLMAYCGAGTCRAVSTSRKHPLANI